MSIDPTRLRLYVKSPRQGRRQAPARGHIAFFIVVCGLCSVIVLGKIYLERQIMQYGTRWEQEHRELSKLVKEAENLRLERESYTNRQYILERARGLDLRAPVPGQVRRLLPSQAADELAPGPSVAANID